MSMGVMAHSGGTDKNSCHSGSKPYHCHSAKKVTWDCVPANWPSSAGSAPRIKHIVTGKKVYDVNNDRTYVNGKLKGNGFKSSIIFNTSSKTIKKIYQWNDGSSNSHIFKNCKTK